MQGHTQTNAHTRQETTEQEGNDVTRNSFTLVENRRVKSVYVCLCVCWIVQPFSIVELSFLWEFGLAAVFPGNRSVRINLESWFGVVSLPTSNLNCWVWGMGCFLASKSVCNESLKQCYTKSYCFAFRDM